MTNRPVRITINDIARMSGVSKKSVSRVINNEPGISDKTRQHIKSVMERENYVPDRRARALAASRSFLVALAYNNLNPSYVLELLRGMQTVAGQYGYEIVMHAVLEQGDKAVSEIRAMMQRSGCDGVVLTPPLSEHPAIIGAFSEESWLAARVAGDDVELPIPQVKYDDRAATVEVTRHLIELGHRKIGFIGGPQDSGSTRRRLAGFKDALMIQGITIDESSIAWGEFTFASGLTGGKEILNRKLRPTAIVCCNDEMASGAIHAVRELGFRVPDDISVTGFDDSPLAQQLWPPLTTVRQPVADMATFAMQSLVGALSKSDIPEKRIDCRHKLVVRKSTGPLVSD